MALKIVELRRSCRGAVCVSKDLKLLLRSLHEHGADYLLIGDYALAAHGYQRATTTAVTNRC